MRLRQICLVAPHLEPVISRYRRDHGAQRLLPRRQRRQIRSGERAAAGRHHPAGSGGAVSAGHRGGALSRQDRRPRRLHGDLLLRRSGRARRACQEDRRAHRQCHRSCALSRRAAASARLPRRLHRIQPHRRQRRYSRPLSAGRAGLAEIDPQGCDAGVDRRRDAKPGAAGAGRALGHGSSEFPSPKVKPASPS